MVRKLVLAAVILLFIAVMAAMVAIVVFPSQTGQLARLPGLSFTPHFESSEREQLTIALTGKLQVHNPIGTIRVEGKEDTDNVQLVSTVKAKAGSRNEAERLLRQVNLEVRQDDDHTLIRVRMPNQISNSELSADLALLVPQKASLEVSADIGSIEVIQFDGDLVTVNNLGSTSISNFRGNADIQSKLGSISIKESEFVETLAVQGNLGKVSVAGRPAVNTTITNQLGSVELKIPRGYAYLLDARYNLGSLNLKIPYRGEQTANSFSGVVGEGSEAGQIFIEVQSGSIEIRN